MNYRIATILSVVGVATIMLGLLLSKPDDAQELSATIGRNISDRISNIDREAVDLLANKEASWEEAKHSFFLMDSTTVLKWNRNDFLPDVRTVQDDFSIRLLKWPRGIFLLKKWNLEQSKFLLAVMPLRNQYKINNRYLVSRWNTEIFPTQDVTINDANGEGYSFIWEGRIIFKLQITNENPTSTGVDWTKFWLIVAGLTILLIGFYIWASLHHANRKYGLVLISCFLFFVGGRLLMLGLFLSPDFPLFNPAYFASSGLNRSIGDLFLNTVSLAIPLAYLFYNYHRLTITKRIILLAKGRSYLVTSILLLLCFFTILYSYLFYETIFHNSSISLDITQSLSFDWIRVFSFLSIILGCITSFMLVHVLVQMATSAADKGRFQFAACIIVAAMIFYLSSLLLDRNYQIPLLIGTGYFVLIRFLRLPSFLNRTSYTTFLYLFVAIVAFAVQGAFSVKRFSMEEKINSQFRFANSFLTDRDYLGEYLLGESIQRISSDPFIQTRLGSPFLSKAVVRQKVKQVYLNAYFDRYDIQIHLFNSTGDSFDGSTSLTFTELITKFQQEASKTNFEGVYFLKNSTAESTKRYLVVIPVNRFAMVTGYIVLDLSLKRVIPKNVFPELLLDDRFIQYFKNRNFSYAFYADDEVTSSFGEFNYEKELTNKTLVDPRLFKQGVIENEYVHVGVVDEVGNTTIVSSPIYPMFYVTTNFSFLFTIGLFIILIGLLIYGLVTLYQREELNYSARIQLYVYLAFILPLVLVSASTLGLIGRSAETQLKEEYLEKSRILGERLAPLIDTYIMDDDVTLTDLENQLIDLAKLANVDATVFSAAGKLLASSQPLIYEDRILSSLIDPTVHKAIVLDDEQSYVNNEQIGLLNYNSSYFAMRSPESGNLIGILSLPFFESAYSLERTQIGVVANIITIFCLVFILFSVLSFFAVRWLTFPLQFITRILRRTTLTESNKPLVWNSNDEIGLMVNEYNKMVRNLEQSKIEISRIQKESAWREIAKQVAHEVKNPLTPMKLTLQQMEQSLLTGNLSNEKTKKSLNTLLQQVEILNEIAASFSAFARMPAPILQKIEITALVKRVVGLHGDYKEGKVTLEIDSSPIFVMGDDQLLSRVFSNILLNALQSKEEEETIVIDVRVYLKDKKCIIRFKDNGKGIEEDLKEKVFLPHFSTKKSGSGLGLAIAKQGIEQNDGTIYFETEKGVGTTFFVEIPTINE